MSQLHTRGKCQIRGCECSGFMTVELNVLSSTPKEACICTHPYWQHLMTAQNMFSRNRWANTERACGGFYPANVTEPLGLNPDCLCLASWLSHSIYKNNADGSIAVANDRPENPVASTSAAMTTHREPSSRNMPSTSSRPPMFSALPRTPSRSRNSNSTRNRSRPNRQIVNNTTGQGSVRRGAGSVQGILPSAPPSVVEFLALLLPFKLPSLSRQSPSYKFSGAEISVLLNALEEHHLTFALSLDGAGDIWEVVIDQITASLSRSGIILALSQGQSSEATGFQSSPIISITPRNAGRGERQLFKEAEITEGTFTVSTIQRISALVNNPRNNDNRPILFFAPRFDHLKGPIPPGTVPHQCFPWKVWTNLQCISSTPTNRGGGCVRGCPTGQNVTPSQTSTRRVARPSSSLSNRSSGSMTVPSTPPRHLTTPQSVAGNSDRQPQQVTRSPASSNDLSSHSLSLLHQASYHSITQWLDVVFNASLNHDEGLTALGPAPEAIANTLIDMLKFHRTCMISLEEVPSFEPRDGVTCELQPLSAFISRFHRFELRTTSAPSAAVGNGPCRAVMRAGVKLLTSSTLFGHHGDFYHPLFHGMESSSSPRVIQSWAAGYWCALHILLLGHIPDPITPWLFFAILYGKDGLPCDIDQLRALDPKLSNDLEPWFHFGAQDTLSPADVQHPVWQLFLNYAAFHDLSILATPRSQEFHQELTEALVAGAIFGSSNPWQGSEYKAFRDGFNLDLGHTHLLDTLRLGDQPHFGRQLLSAMSNRRISRVRHITDKLEFVTRSAVRSPLHDAITDVFQYRILRWLHGKGHPTELRGSHVPVEAFDRDRDDSLLRARLLLRALADTDLLPVDPYFVIKFSLSIPVASGTVGFAPPVVDIHTCDARAHISVNEWLQIALQEDCSLHDNKSTKFDIWFHTQMILSGYNRS